MLMKTDMADKPNTSERDQLLNTAKMLEAIVGNQPDDYQTLETLEDIYQRVGQPADSLRAAKLAAKAYIRAGMISKALNAYESILERDPNDAEAAKVLQSLNAQAEASAAPSAAASPAAPEMAKRVVNRAQMAAPREDYDLMLGKYLITHNVITQRHLDSLQQDLKKQDASAGQVPASNLIDLMQERGLAQADAVLELLCDKFRLSHLPLTFYDIDSDTVRLLPRDVCFRYLTLPFDRIGRTLLLSASNPYMRAYFDPMAAKMGLTFQWYLNMPNELRLVLQNVYRLGSGEAEAV